MTMSIIVRIAGFTQVAAFNPPKRGDRITINSPRALFTRAPYWLVTDVSGSASQGWNATVRGQDGNSQALHSSDVTSWKIYAGDKYPWEIKEQEDKKKKIDEENRTKDVQREKSQYADFSQRYKFSNGDPLFVPLGGLLVSVSQQAVGQLDLFSGKTLRIKSINPTAETVQMEPVVSDDPSLSEFGQFIESVPAKEVVENTTPVLSAAMSSRKVSVPDLSMPPDENGKRPTKMVEEGSIPRLVPNLVEAILRGQVSGPYRDGKFVEVYVNYDKDKGLERFNQEMASYGVSYPEDEIVINNARYTERYMGQAMPMKSPMYYYSGAIHVSSPTPELIEEIQKVAPASKIKHQGNGIIIQSNTLFRLYVKLAKPFMSKSASKIVTWIRATCKLA